MGSRMARALIAFILACSLGVHVTNVQAQTAATASLDRPLSADAASDLARLIAARKLRPATSEDLQGWVQRASPPADRFGRVLAPNPQFPLERTFVVLSDVDLGPRFVGTDAIGLILPAGAPIPRGSTSAGPIYRATAPFCRGAFCPPPVRRAADAEMRADARFDAGCAIQVPPDTVVYAVGAYESKVPAQRRMRGNRPGIADLAITETTRPVALVVTSYESMLWRIGLAPGANLVGVFASGYYDQLVEGIPGSVPVIIASPPDGPRSRCTNRGMYGYNLEQHLAVFDAVGRAVFGRAPDEFRLAYAVPPFVTIGPDYKGPVTYFKDRGDAFAVDTNALPPGMQGVHALAERGLVRRATSAELLQWVEGYERATGEPLKLSGPAHAWMITGTKELPSHPGGWANIFILPAGAEPPDDPGGTWAILWMDDFTCSGRDCHALLGYLGTGRRPPQGRLRN